MKKLIYLLAILLSAELWLSAQVIAADKPILMGVFPRRNAKVTIRMFTPLAEYLSMETGLNIKVATTKNFSTFWKNVTNRRYGIVHYNQLHYIESHANKGYQVITYNEEFGEKVIRSAFVVRKNDGIGSVKDLKGKTILFGGGKKAFIAYVSNVVTLHRAGLSKSDYVTKFAKNPPNAMIAISLKQGDAAGSGEVGIKIPILKKKGVNVSELKLIGIGDAFPHLPWAVNSDINDNIRSAIQKAMMKLNDSAEGKLILQKAGMTGIHKAADRDYDSSRKLIEEYRSIQ